MDSSTLLEDKLFKKYAIITGKYVYGLSHTQIAEKINVSKQYVSKVLQKFQDNDLK